MEQDSARVRTRALRSWVYGVALLLAVFLVVTECSMSPDRSEADDKPETELPTETEQDPETEPETEPDNEPTPEVTIAAAEDSVTEGDTVSFTVTAMPAPEASLVVSVTVTETGDSLSESESESRNVTIEAGKTTATLQVTTDDDDITEESGTTLTATVNDGTGYTVGFPGSAEATVADNDGASTPGPTLPPATEDLPHVTIMADQSRVTEGDSMTFTVRANPAPRAAPIVHVTVAETGDTLVASGALENVQDHRTRADLGDADGGHPRRH